MFVIKSSQYTFRKIQEARLLFCFKAMRSTDCLSDRKKKEKKKQVPSIKCSMILPSGAVFEFPPSTPSDLQVHVPALVIYLDVLFDEIFGVMLHQSLSTWRAS